MSFEVLTSASAAGTLNGISLLLPTLAVAILYQHGRYVPVWLPDLGLLGAYLVHALWARGIPGTIAALIAFAATGILACIIHRALVARFLSVKDYLSPLLVGLGLSQMFQAVVSVYGDGMSQHYPDNIWANQFFSRILGTTVYSVDVLFIASTLFSLTAMYAYLHFTNWGTKVRMVMSNPGDSRKLGLPVGAVDATILVAASLLVTAGTIMRGIRFDLQPTMMFYPGLGVIAACIVATPGRHLTALVVIVVIELIAGIIGTTPAYSALQRGVPFAVLLAVLVTRAILIPGARALFDSGMDSFPAAIRRRAPA